METIKKMMDAAIDRMNTSGELEKMIQKKITECVDNAIGSYFGYKMSQQIAEALQAALVFDPKRIGFEQFTDSIIKTVQSRLQVLTAEQVQKIDEVIKAQLEQPPDEIKLSDLMNRFRHDRRDDIKGLYTLHIEPETYGDGYMIRFDTKAAAGKWECAYTIRVDREQKVWLVEIGNKKGEDIFLRRLWGFDMLVYRLWMHKSKLIVDTRDIDTSSEENDDENED